MFIIEIQCFDINTLYLEFDAISSLVGYDISYEHDFSILYSKSDLDACPEQQILYQVFCCGGGGGGLMRISVAYWTANTRLQITLVKCWTSVSDGGPALKQHWSDVHVYSLLIITLTIVYDTIIWSACFSSISPSIINRFSWNFAQDISKSSPNFAKLYVIFHVNYLCWDWLNQALAQRFLKFGPAFMALC